MAKHTGHTITSDSALGSAVIQRSLRFNRADNAVLTRSPSSTTNSTKQTLSFWFKVSSLNDATNQGHFFAGGSDGSWSYVQLWSDTFYFGNSAGPYWNGNLAIRDFSAWYHATIVIDTTQSTADDRQKFYLNGVQQTKGNAGSNNPNQNDNYEYLTNSSWTYYIGKRATNDHNFDGYMAEINFVQGQALEPTQFGFTDPVTNIWLPKRYEGTYGTNGFYLDFSDNSSTAALGIDKSPNGNDWTTSNFSVSAGEGNDSLEDTPTNNFCTLNTLFMNGTESADCSNGNLDFTADNNYQEVDGTMSVKTGKWYWEVKPTSNPSNSAPQNFGITRGTGKGENSYVGYDNNSNGYGYSYDQTGNVVGGGSGDGVVNGATLATGQTTFTQNDIIGVAVDIPNGYLIFYKNGSHLYTISGINSHDWFPAFSAYASGTFSVNFGQRPFSYTPPVGHKSLCSANLPPNVPSIINPQKHFECLTYTGTATGSGTQTISDLEFAPDFVWIKSRAIGYSHLLVDTVRGASKGLLTESTDVEETSNQYGMITSFGSNGFTMTRGSSDGGKCCENTQTYVAWNWKAGGSSNTFNVDGTGYASASAAGITEGSISLTGASINKTSRFSIVTYTGNSTDGATVGHGLGVEPSFVLIKSRNLGTVGTAGAHWSVSHQSLTGGLNGGSSAKKVFLSLTNGETGNSHGTVSAASSTTVTFKDGTGNSDDAHVNNSSGNYVMYSWAEVPGYSKFGRYYGNQNADGSFVFLGFRPALVITKGTWGGNWNMYDNSRNSFNVANKTLYPNLSNAESTESSSGNQVDLLSNGFKLRGSNIDTNHSADFIYLAFAEQPGVTSFDTFPNAR